MRDSGGNYLPYIDPTQIAINYLAARHQRHSRFNRRRSAGHLPDRLQRRPAQYLPPARAKASRRLHRKDFKINEKLDAQFELTSSTSPTPPASTSPGPGPDSSEQRLLRLRHQRLRRRYKLQQHIAPTSVTARSSPPTIPLTSRPPWPISIRCPTQQAREDPRSSRPCFKSARAPAPHPLPSSANPPAPTMPPTSAPSPAPSAGRAPSPLACTSPSSQCIPPAPTGRPDSWGPDSGPHILSFPVLPPLAAFWIKNCLTPFSTRKNKRRSHEEVQSRP